MLVKQVEALEKENDELRRQMVSMRVADLSADNFDVDAKVQDVINENENLKHRVVCSTDHFLLSSVLDWAWSYDWCVGST